MSFLLYVFLSLFGVMRCAGKTVEWLLICFRDWERKESSRKASGSVPLLLLWSMNVNAVGPNRSVEPRHARLMEHERQREVRQVASVWSGLE
jgi:hypothetical protein